MALRSITIASDGLLRTPEGTRALIIAVRGLLDIDQVIFKDLILFSLFIEQAKIFDVRC